MNKKLLSLIFRNEVRNVTRNHNLMLFILLIPLVIFPIFILVPPIIASPALDPSPLLVINLDNGAQGLNLTRQIAQVQGLLVTIGDSSWNPRQVVQSGQFDAALVIPENFSSIIAANQTASLQLYYDSSYSRATIGVGLLNSAILSYSEQVVILRNPKSGVLNPVGTTPTPVTGVRPLISTIASLLPILWVGWATLAGAYLAFDLRATEEKDSTLSTLLLSPFARYELFAGKTLSVLAISVLTSIVAVVGIYGIPTMGVLIGSGFRSYSVAGTVPFTAALVSLTGFGVALIFMLSEFILQFLTLFLAGAGRVRFLLGAVVSIGASTAFLLSTIRLSVAFRLNLFPFFSTYSLLSRAVAGVVTAADLGSVLVPDVLVSLLFLFLAYRELLGEGLLLRSVFPPYKKSEEEEETRAEATSTASSLNP